MNISTQLNYREDAMMNLRSIYFGAYERDSKSLYEEKAKIYSFLKEKKLPERMMQYIRGYDHALYDRFMSERLVFLYEVDGKFYKTKNSVKMDLPKWDELPKEIWNNLGNCGGYYFRETLKKFCPK